MTKIRQRKYLLAIAALVLVFAGCKGESPTSPTPTTPGGGTGGVTPPTSATINLAVSNPTPLVDSTTVVTASVTVDNAPAPNGTAVQFQTTLGTFTDANAAATIRTTTGGVATATLTSSSAGTATVTVTVNNVSKSTQVTFTLKPTTPNPPDTTPTISGVTPTTGRPAGGEIITINGKNLVTPVRVLFDYGTGSPKEAQVISASSTQIQAITPPVDLGTGQTKDATIIVISNAGTAGEVRITGPKFTYQAEVLTPKVTTVSPGSGPIDGGTRVTIFGEGFQAPVQVFFAPAPYSAANPGGEAQVVNVTFSQITVIAPAASSTAPGGSGVVTGPVDIRIVNVNSATSVVAPSVFKYAPKMAITAAGPTVGSYTGGTTVTIDGTGFNDPVAVVIGGVAAMPIKVSGTQILAVTGAPVITGCSNITGPISVTNVDNGDTATGPSFTYLIPKPTIVNVSPALQTAGGALAVTVAGAGAGAAKFTLGDKTVFATSATVNPDGTITYGMTIPTTYTFTSGVCTGSTGVAGTQQLPLTVNVVYTNAATGCTDTANSALTINPTSTACTFAPIAAVSPSSVNAGTAPAAGTVQTAPPGTFTISNMTDPSGPALQVGAPVTTFTNATSVVVTPNTSGSIPAGSSRSYTVTVDPAAAGAVNGTITFSTNDPKTPTLTVTVTATGT